MRGKAVTHAHGPQAGAASGFDVDVGVADDGGFFWSHAMLVEQLASAFGVGLLSCKTISAIDLRKKRAQSKCLDNGTRWDDRFVRQYRHLARNPFGFCTPMAIWNLV